MSNNLKSVIKQQYSTVNKNNITNSTVKPLQVLSNITDLVHEGYEPFYATQLKRLGYNRFMQLANKARAGSDTPQRLFCWMLKNDELVR